MKRLLSLLFALILLFCVAVTRSASAKTITLPPDNPMGNLKPGPGLDVVRANCGLCHSTDYIVRQQGGDVKHWEPEVRKMVTVFGAPVSEADVKTIVNYLATAYGPQNAEGSKQKGQDSKRK